MTEALPLPGASDRGAVAGDNREKGATIVRVNGPLVEATGLDRVAMLDVVEIGPSALPAEVVSVASDGHAVVQAYEYTGGLQVGDPVTALGQPLSASLGPGLLGGIFDGMLRPLAGGPDWLEPGALGHRRADERLWHFTPTAVKGDHVEAGSIIGTVPTTGGIEYRVLVPPGIAGKLEWVAEEGDVTDVHTVATVGEQQISVGQSWPVRRPRPVEARLMPSEPLFTGQRVVDLLYPVAKGSTVAVPGGFGTGKTVLLQQIVKWCNADVIVFVGCGERGNELAEALSDLGQLSDPRTGKKLLDRTVVVANTSNMPVMAREASIFTGMTVAEFFRDMGHDTVLLADSTSRWAEALREFSSRSGELPAEEGYPAGLASAIAAFYERASLVRTLGGREGSVTVIGAVSPAGGDMTEPVTAHTERFVRSLWSLDRDLAYARHYPALSWRRSFSRDVEAVASWYGLKGRTSWQQDRASAMFLLGEADRLAPVVELVGLTALPPRERMILLGARLVREGVLQQSALSSNDAYCGPEKQAALLEMALTVYRRCLELVDHGVAAEEIEKLDLSAAARARDEVGSDDGAGISSRRDQLLEMLQGIG